MGRENLRNENRNTVWYSLIAVSIAATIMTANMTAPFFYLNWILGGAMIVWFAAQQLKPRYRNTMLLMSILIASIWTIVPIVSSIVGSVQDSLIQAKKIAIYLFNVILSGAIVYALQRINTRKKAKYLTCLCLVWLVIGFASLLFYTISFASYYEIFKSTNFAGIFQNRNNFSVATVLLLSLVILYKDLIGNKAKTGVIIVALSVLVLFTQSLKGLIGLIILLAYALWVEFHEHKHNGNRFKRAITILTIVFVAGVCVLLFTQNPVSDRMNKLVLLITSPSDLASNESVSLRAFFARKSLEVITENPITGIGFGNSIYYLIHPNMVSKGITIGTYSHMNYLEMLLGGGIISFVLYYIPLIVAAFILLRKKPKERNDRYIVFIAIFIFAIDFAAVTYDMIIFNLLYVSMIYSSFKEANHANK